MTAFGTGGPLIGPFTAHDALEKHVISDGPAPVVFVGIGDKRHTKSNKPSLIAYRAHRKMRAKMKAQSQRVNRAKDEGR